RGGGPSGRAGGAARERGLLMSSRWPFLPPRSDSIRHRLVLALDVETFAEAERLVRLLAKDVGVFKVGKQLFLHSGPEVVRMIHSHGVDVFLDLKFHDIPHTVARAGIEAARLGVRFFDLHASGSFEMMERTAAEDDQKRMMTPEEAMRAGADYLVLGRPIRDAKDPLAAVQEVVAEMARGFLMARARPGMRSG